MTDLADVLSMTRADATVLRRHGDTRVADAIDSLCARVERAAEEWLTWLSETDAALKCGYSTGWLRVRFGAWEREGHARRTPNGERQYRACIVPRRAQVARAAARGRLAARELRKAS